MFKKGSKVICINDKLSKLKNGDVYTVLECHYRLGDWVVFTEEFPGIPMYPERFSHVETETK